MEKRNEEAQTSEDMYLPARLEERWKSAKQREAGSQEPRLEAGSDSHALAHRKGLHKNKQNMVTEWTTARTWKTSLKLKSGFSTYKKSEETR